MDDLFNNPEYLEVLSRVKQTIATSRQRAMLKVNSEVICMYWQVGLEILPHLGWGSNFIDSLSRDIRSSYPGVKGFSARSMRYMAKFAREVDPDFLQQLAAKIPWGHIMLLLDKTKPGPEREWYVHAIIENGWSRAVLLHQLDSHLYERQALSGKVTNFTRTLPAPESELAQQALKDPYIFDFITTRQSMEEHDIEEQMVRNVTQLLLELGTGFAFMGRQYHLVVGGEDFYIDLLFYNVKLRCYVVVELKNTEFKPEYTGKLSFYVSAVDGELRADGDRPTIGLLLCKTKNDVVAEYSLKDINQPIGVSEYRLGDELPEDYAAYLPSPADLQARI